MPFSSNGCPSACNEISSEPASSPVCHLTIDKVADNVIPVSTSSAPFTSSTSLPALIQPIAPAAHTNPVTPFHSISCTTERRNGQSYCPHCGAS
ncbi:hypothetical protein HOLleu_27990 [Holothuria leucospilota]|uniref:Uncharacterized protein n=1 Tax=Holothuria leucospilota TaxID=206669 RepID=A0A9Q1H368_HOLLE|nr:hypothetical protein HOLleu_27990 [Holothuria leucospilota]